MDRVSCIIPMFNEGSRIGNVLSVINSCDFLDEVIVVDDCSTDNSSEIAAHYSRVTLLRHETNRGKSAAIHTGITHASGSILLFVDADLLGLSVQAVHDLVEPVRTNKADMSISLRGNTPLHWRMIGLDFISGERCIRKDALTEFVPTLLDIDGFQLEVKMNDVIIHDHRRIAVVWWPKVRSPLKRKRYGIYLDIFIMMFIIFSYLSPAGVARQIWSMKKQTIRP